MNDLDVEMRLRLINQLSGPAKQAKRDLAGIRGETDRLSKSRGLDNAARGLSKYKAAAIGLAGGAIAGGILAVGKGIKFATGESMQFDTAMIEVRKASDLTDQQFEQLKRSILQTSSATGVAKENLAGLVAEAAKSGRPFSELVEFSVLASKASIAFGLSAEESSSRLSKLAGALRLNIDQVDDLANVINHLADNSKSSERGILEFLNRAGSTGKIAGLASEEIAAFGSTFEGIGVRSEVAATGFEAFVKKIATADKQNKKFRGGLKELGTSAKELMAAFKQDPSAALVDFLKRINSVQDGQERLGILTDMFGLGYSDDVGKLAGAVGELEKALGLVADKADRAGSLDKSFALFDEDTTQKVTKAGIAFDNFATRIGEKFTPAVAAAADASAKFFNYLSDALDKQKELEILNNKLNGGESLSTKDQENLASDAEMSQKAQMGRRTARGKAVSELAHIKDAQKREGEGKGTKNTKKILHGNVDQRIKDLEAKIANLSSVDNKTSTDDLQRQRIALIDQLNSLPKTISGGRGGARANPAISEVARQIDQINKELNGALLPFNKTRPDALEKFSSIPKPTSRPTSKIKIDIAPAKTALAGKQIGDGAASSMKSEAAAIGAEIGRAAAIVINKAGIQINVANSTVRNQNKDVRGSRNGALHDVGAPS